MNLTLNERENFKFILPVQSDIKSIELVVRILDKIKFDEKENQEINFDEDEILFLKDTINYLDKTKKIFLQSFSLVQKILRS
jgi:hypothetical protein